MTDNDEEWLVSAQSRDGDEPFKGSVIRWCSICAASIWLSPQAITKMADNHKLKPICLECAVPMLASHDKVSASAVDPSAPEAPIIQRQIRKLIQEARKARQQ